MQLEAVGLSGASAALTDAVQEVPHRLVGDEQAQQAAATRAWQRPEKRGAVGISALAIQGAQRVPPDYLIRYLCGVDSPLAELAGYGRYTPDELARYAAEEGMELARR